MKKLGGWLFLAGLGLALVSAFAPNVLGAIGGLLLALLGAGVGYLNIRGHESVTLIVGSLGLTATVGALSVLPAVGSLVTSIASSLLVFLAPMTLVVSLLAVFRVSKN